MTRSGEAGRAVRRIAAFLLLVVLCEALAIWASVHFGLPGRLAAALSMWSPGLSAILVKLGFDRTIRGLGFGRSGGRWLAVALLLPVAYALPVYLLVWTSGLGGFAPANWAAAVPYIAAPKNAGVALALLLTLGLADKFSRALGEEIGWRGFLVPEFLKLTSFRNAALITGAIWAVWHVPAMLYEGYNSGPVPFAYQFACFAVMVISSGVFFAWLRVESDSVWPPALLHAAHNLVVQSIFDAATVNHPYTLYITGEFGCGLALTTAAVALIVLGARGRTSAARG